MAEDTFITCDDGCRLHYQICGPNDGVPIVLSNSLGTSLAMWAPQIADLCKSFRVLRYDQRGHGLSTAPAGAYSLERLGRDVLNILDSLQIEQAHFCGISMGGLTGQWLAINAPARINWLILANTAARIGQSSAWDERIASIRSSGVEPLCDAIMERWFTPDFLGSQSGFVTNLRGILAKISPAGYAGCCAAIRDADLSADLHRIAHETLIIAGLRDIATPPEQARDLHSAMPASTLLELDAAHLSNIELPEQFTQAIMDFLK